MALSNGQYEAIMREYDSKRSYHRQEQLSRQEQVYARIPRLLELDDESSSLAVRQARRLLEGDPDAVGYLSDELAKIDAERSRLLTDAGYPADYLDMKYDCPVCHDTGYVENHKCRCFLQRELDLLYHQSGIRERLEKENFSTCTDQCYSDTQMVEGRNVTVRAYMREVIEECKEYAADFDSRGGSLLFYGSTGVGKTFLAGCIAKELIETYHSVLYLSATELFDVLARERLSREADEETQEAARSIMDCDLLIIDDLGTELNNSLTNSELFNCLNERVLNSKSTIITTNLTPNGLTQMYSERIGSRLIENFRFYALPDGDIRIWKQREQRRKRGGK